jgi:hypothetical protein
VKERKERKKNKIRASEKEEKKLPREEKKEVVRRYRPRRQIMRLVGQVN